jgi:methylation protein EvaC
MRYVLARSGKYTPTNRAHDLLRAEKVDGLDRVDTYYEFAHRVEKSAVDLRQTLTKVLEESHHVAAFGATSKSTTIYNFAGIDSSLISKIYDNSPTKIGKFSPGMRIPIVSSELFPEESHRYVFLAAWNHETEIRQRYRSFEGPGRRWIVHVPHVRFL